MLAKWYIIFLPENGQIELRSHFLQKILIEDTMLGTYLGCATQKLIVSDGKENFYPSLKEQSLPKCQPPIWDSIRYMDFSFWSHWFLKFLFWISSQLYSTTKSSWLEMVMQVDRQSHGVHFRTCAIFSWWICYVYAKNWFLVDSFSGRSQNF